MGRKSRRARPPAGRRPMRPSRACGRAGSIDRRGATPSARRPACRATRDARNSRHAATVLIMTPDLPATARLFFAPWPDARLRGALLERQRTLAVAAPGATDGGGQAARDAALPRRRAPRAHPQAAGAARRPAARPLRRAAAGHRDAVARRHRRAGECRAAGRPGRAAGAARHAAAPRGLRDRVGRALPAARDAGARRAGRAAAGRGRADRLAGGRGRAGRVAPRVYRTATSC